MYYWKSVFRLTGSEKQFLRNSRVTTVYIKYFDVDLVAEPDVVVPLSSLQEDQGSLHDLSAIVSIVPVVFITQQALQLIPDTAIPRYAMLIANRIEKMNGTFQVTPKEWQIDCDWTASTANRYFSLLRRLREHMHPNGTRLSATLRLYPFKYRSKMGVPPVDRAMLMCYNMGNLTNPATSNSILDTKEMEKYLQVQAPYPLPLDAALPIFSWFVWFRDREYKGLVYPTVVEKTGWKIKEGRIVITSDTVMNGRQYLAGDWLRLEEPGIQALDKARKMINNSISGHHISRLALFHLDSLILNKYNANALEDLFDGSH